VADFAAIDFAYLDDESSYVWPLFWVTGLYWFVIWDGGENGSTLTFEIGFGVPGFRSGRVVVLFWVWDLSWIWTV